MRQSSDVITCAALLAVHMLYMQLCPSDEFCLRHVDQNMTRMFYHLWTGRNLSPLTPACQCRHDEPLWLPDGLNFFASHDRLRAIWLHHMVYCARQRVHSRIAVGCNLLRLSFCLRTRQLTSSNKIMEWMVLYLCLACTFSVSRCLKFYVCAKPNFFKFDRVCRKIYK